MQPEWPNNGIEFNRWYSGLGRFIAMLQRFEWIKDSRFKYVNVRIDTRNGNFLVLSDHKDDGEQQRVNPMLIAKHVDMTSVDDAERQKRTGAHVLDFARKIGWTDDGEGALEFLLRQARETAFEDCGRHPNHGDQTPTRDLILAALKQNIFPRPTVNVVCDIEGFEEATAAILKVFGDPLAKLRRVRESMMKHYNEGNTYEMGYSTSLGSLMGFIREIDKCLTPKT